MLPLHSSHSARNPYFLHQYGSPSSSWDSPFRSLFSRSRATNFLLILLTSFLVFSLMFNFHFYFHVPVNVHRSEPLRDLDNLHTQAVEIDSARARLTHLIMVPGHAIWEGQDANDVYDENRWILESYQKDGKSVEAFLEHIRKGVELTLSDPSSLLIFSGGQTRPSALTTEASAYLHLAHTLELFPGHTPRSPFPRATTEIYALDSFQNLLFSIARFKEFTGRYPTSITVVGFGMKKRRFEELHRSAIRWPLERWYYVGVDVKGDMKVQYEGEYLNGYLPFTRDLYGCHSFLENKRRMRNPFSRYHPYLNSAHELTALFQHCPHEIQHAQIGDMERMVLPGSKKLPWDDLN